VTDLIARLGGPGPYRAVQYVRGDSDLAKVTAERDQARATSEILCKQRDRAWGGLLGIGGFRAGLPSPAGFNWPMGQPMGTRTGRISTKTKNISNRPKIGR